MRCEDNNERNPKGRIDSIYMPCQGKILEGKFKIWVEYQQIKEITDTEKRNNELKEANIRCMPSLSFLSHVVLSNDR